MKKKTISHFYAVVYINTSNLNNVSVLVTNKVDLWPSMKEDIEEAMLFLRNYNFY